MNEKGITTNDYSDSMAMLKSTIACIDGEDDSAKSFRNGIRYAVFILTGEEQVYEI